MPREFPELPGWSFDAEEVSAGVYRAFGRGPVEMSKPQDSTQTGSSRSAERQQFRSWPILKNPLLLREAAVHKAFV